MCVPRHHAQRRAPLSRPLGLVGEADAVAESGRVCTVAQRGKSGVDVGVDAEREICPRECSFFMGEQGKARVDKEGEECSAVERRQHATCSVNVSRELE